MQELKQLHKKLQTQINSRLNEFKDIGKLSDRKIFIELCFCVLTSQSKAVFCDEAIKSLVRSKALFNGSEDDIKNHLRKVRFPNNKSKYLIYNRNLFQKGTSIEIKSKIDQKDIIKTRDWFAKTVMGIGFKEASHFLRNIGLGQNLAILDVHILKNLHRYKVINEIPKSISPKKYLEIEEKMRNFSTKLQIPLDELDFVLWAKQTGYIFK